MPDDCTTAVRETISSKKLEVLTFLIHYFTYKLYIYIDINSETLVEKIFESAQHFRSGNYYLILM